MSVIAREQVKNLAFLAVVSVLTAPHPPPEYLADGRFNASFVTFINIYVFETRKDE